MRSSSSVLARSHHEETLLPLARAIAEELLRAVPRSAKLEAIVFRAEFPAPGEVVRAGVILHELDGERRAIRLRLGAEGRKLVTDCSLYKSDQRLTSIEIKIAADGHFTTSFGTAIRPRSEEELKAYFDRLYGAVPEAPAPTLKPAGFFTTLLRPLFGPKLKLYPLPALKHRPLREPLSLFLDRMDGIHEGWDDPPSPAVINALKAAPELPPPPSAEALKALAGKQLVVPEQEGVLFAEAQDIFHIAVSELHRRRPTLRFDPLETRLVRDLGPGLGELQFIAWDGYVTAIRLSADDIPSFDALLERLEPVLAALGGLGPLVCALNASHPGVVRDVTPVGLDEVRAALVPMSPYGRRVYPCWLLGRPAHTKVGLNLSVECPDGRLLFGYDVAIELPAMRR